jgi:hypothetical protein
LHNPVLYNSRVISPPRFPIPIQARFTFSPALTGLTAGKTDPETVLVKIVGMAVAAVSVNAFFKKTRLDDSFGSIGLNI